jgi:WD40 repeat protein
MQRGVRRLWNVGSGREIRRFDGDLGSVFAVAFSPDGHLLLTAGKDIRLWEVATGRELRKFQAGAESCAAFSPDGRFILTCGRDTTIHVWNPATATLIASLVSFSEGGWAVVDPDGRYDASDPDNSAGLHFVAGDDVIGLGQLKQRFYTPGLLARIWRGENLPEITDSLKEIKLVPGVKVQPPAPGSMDAIVRLTNRGRHRQSHGQSQRARTPIRYPWRCT